MLCMFNLDYFMACTHVYVSTCHTESSRSEFIYLNDEFSRLPYRELTALYCNR
jgi:hypothetical protein